MAITIPDRKQIRLTTDFLSPNNGHSLPALLTDTAMTNPQPVSISASGATADVSTQAQCTPSSGISAPVASAYIGFQSDSNTPVGAAVSPVHGVVVDGYAGVTPGAPVYIDIATAADAAPTNSGLTHTQPGTASKIGVGWTANKIYFF